MRKRLVSISLLLILLLNAIPLVLNTEPIGSSGSSETIKVSQARQLTTSPLFDRNPSFLKTTDGTWFVFFARGRGDPSLPGYNPDTDYYDICYIKSTDSGLTWTEVSLPSIPDGHGMGAFTPAALQDYTGKIWVFYAANGVGIFYFTSIDNGSTWIGPTAVPNVVGFTVWNHLDAIKADFGTIWVFYHGDPGSAIYARKYDGVSWSSPILVDDRLDYTSTPRALQEADGTFRVVYIAGDPLQIYMANSADGINWYQSSIINTPNDDYDPMLVKDGSTWRLFFAPYIPADDHQWLMTTYSTDLSTWASPLMVTMGYSGSNKWWDFYPEAVVASSELVLFYASMKDGNQRGDDEIYMFKVDWDLTKNHYDFIQPAIDAASAGDTVLVQDGTYREALVINKNITLKTASKPIIEAPDTRKTYIIPESSATFDPIIFAYGGTESGGTVSGSGTVCVTIDGFEIDGRNKAASARFIGIHYRNIKPGGVSNVSIHDMYDADGEGNGPQTFGILVYGDSNVTIESNEVEEFSRGGLGVVGDAGPKLDPVAVVKQNRITGNGLEIDTDWWAENGIQLGFGAGGRIIENNVTNCKVNNPSWVSTGILVINAVQGVEALCNNVMDCDTGIAVSAIGSPSMDVIDGNNVTGCTWDALRLGLDGPVDHVSVSNNIITNSMIGIGVWDSSDNIIEDNIIQENEYGIIIDGDSNNNQIAQNNITDNTVDGVLVEPYGGFDPLGTQIHYNNIASNGVYGVEVTGTNLSDARFNWWGDASGPYHPTNPSGLGDDITDYVDYSPWLGFVVGTSPMTWHVNPTGAPSAIQEAIDEASSEDTIIVHDGTYNEALHIFMKSLTIESASNPVIQGSQLVTTNYGDREAVIFVEESVEVVLEGLDIEGLGFGYGLPKSYGVIYEESTGSVKNCIVSTNLVGDMYDIGIAAWDNSILTISSCTVRNFGRIGIFYYDGCSGGVYDSIIEGQVYNDENYVNYGIEVEPWNYQCNIEIIGNDIYNCDNTNPSPSWSSAGIVIDGWRAFYDLPMSVVEILNNRIHDNYYGIEVVANSLSWARCNSITKNREYGIIQDPDYADNNVPFDAILNWWRDCSGPYHNTSWTYIGAPYGPNLGLGDRVSDYVLYVPWVGAHDIAVANIAEPPIVFQGYDIGRARIHVTVINRGFWTETFPVTVYAINATHTIEIGTQAVTNLAPSGHVTLTFLWNTTGWSNGNYTMKACASPVPGEVLSLQGDNTCYADDEAMLMLLGDLGGPINYVPTFFAFDGKVDAWDLALFIACYKGQGP